MLSKAQASPKKKRLIIRLSSLGDVIMASSALTALRELGPAENHWVVGKEAAEVLRGHPQISKLWEFDRRGGYSAWKSLLEDLWREGFDEVLDLHSSLRSRMAQVFFLLRGLSSARRVGWRRISKQRFRLLSYFLLKGVLPRSFRPTPYVVRFAKLAGGTGSERPDLRHLLVAAQVKELSEGSLIPGKYLCVMPSSRWSGKQWPVEKYVIALKRLNILPVVMGTSGDSASRELVNELKNQGIGHISGVGHWSLEQTAKVLHHSIGYFGSDTGLAHLAEAVGARAFVVMGPTVQDMGYAPHLPESRTIGMKLWCRPCGKDGSHCHRLMKRHHCLKALSAEDVLSTLQSLEIQ